MSVAATLLSPSDRDRALRAISSLCAELGYEETSVEQVAARAEITVGAFHELFADKEECAVAAVNAILGEMMSVFAGSYSADRSDLDGLLVGLKAILEFMAANPSFSYLSQIGVRQMAPTRVRDQREAGIRLLRAMLERLWTHSEATVQPMALPTGALGGPEALVRREVACGRSGDLPLLLPDLVYAATVSYIGQREALRLARRGRELLEIGGWR